VKNEEVSAQFKRVPQKGARRGARKGNAREGIEGTAMHHGKIRTFERLSRNVACKKREEIRAVTLREGTNRRKHGT